MMPFVCGCAQVGEEFDELAAWSGLPGSGAENAKRFLY
jgi:hypothetical protein